MAGWSAAAGIALPEGAREDAPPDWLVFGAMIRTVSMNEGEPGLTPLVAALEEEGFSDFTRRRAGRELLAPPDGAQRRLGRARLRARSRRNICSACRATRACARIDENGDLLVRRLGKVEVERNRLVRKLGVPSWLDPATRGPRS